MKKIIVVSDSHGNSEKLDFIFKNFKFDYLFHLGDGYKDLGLYLNLPNVYAVRGNCDFFVDAKDEIRLTIEGCDILLTHGDNYGVKYGYEKLANHCKDNGIDIVCFGHTHNYFYEKINGVILINPGALKKQLFDRSTAVILEIDGKAIKVVPFFV